MQEIPLPSADPQANLKDYEKACATFHWEEVAMEFDWYSTGQMNMAHEAIDRQAQSGRKDKFALLYVDRTGRRNTPFRVGMTNIS